MRWWRQGRAHPPWEGCCIHDHWVRGDESAAALSKRIIANAVNAGPLSRCKHGRVRACACAFTPELAVLVVVGKRPRQSVADIYTLLSSHLCEAAAVTLTLLYSFAAALLMLCCCVHRAGMKLWLSYAVLLPAACLPEARGACLGKVAKGSADWERIALEGARTVPGRESESCT